jgi:hypothetical protein
MIEYIVGAGIVALIIGAASNEDKENKNENTENSSSSSSSTHSTSSYSSASSGKCNHSWYRCNDPVTGESKGYSRCRHCNEKFY